MPMSANAMALICVLWMNEWIIELNAFVCLHSKKGGNSDCIKNHRRNWLKIENPAAASSFYHHECCLHYVWQVKLVQCFQVYACMRACIRVVMCVMCVSIEYSKHIISGEPNGGTRIAHRVPSLQQPKNVHIHQIPFQFQMFSLMHSMGFVL